MSKNENTAILDTIKYTYYQEGNCVDGGDEKLEIEIKSSLGIDNDEGGFFVIKTKQWSFDSPEELYDILNRIKGSTEKAINK